MKTSTLVSHQTSCLAISGSLLVLLFLSGCQTTGTSKPNENLDTPTLEGELAASVPELLREGDAAVKQNKSDIAKIKYALVLEQDKSNVEAMYKLGVLHTIGGSLDLAEGLLRRVRQTNPDHRDAREALGTVLLKQKRFTEAEKLLEEALESRPDSASILNAMGIIKDMKAEHSEAQTMFRAALFQEPASARTHNNLGYSLYLSGDLENAEDEFLQAIDLDTNYAQAWSNLALVYSRQGQYSKARSAFNKIVNEHQTANNIGYLGILNNDTGIASQELNKAVTLSPSYYQLANENLAVLGDRQNQPQISQRTAIGSDARADGNRAISSNATNRVASINRIVVGDGSQTQSGEFLQRTAKPKNLMSIRQVQTYLNFLGFRVVKTDGRLGPATRSAIKDFQQSQGMNSTGRLSNSTKSRLRWKTISKVQKSLAMLGHEPGSIDGKAGTATHAAIRRFQNARSFPVTGSIDDSLLRALSESLSRHIDQLSDPNTLDASARG